MWLNVYHNAAGEEDFGEKPILALPKKAFCDFMQSTYKDKLYSSIKDYSNLPNPDDCPVKAVNNFVLFMQQFLYLKENFRTISSLRIIHLMPANIQQ